MLISTWSSSGIDAPSLTVDDNMSLDPKASLMTSDELLDVEKSDAEEDTKRLVDSKAELNPEGVSRSARLRKLGSPRTARRKYAKEKQKTWKLTMAESEDES